MNKDLTCKNCKGKIPHNANICPYCGEEIRINKEKNTPPPPPPEDENREEQPLPPLDDMEEKQTPPPPEDEPTKEQQLHDEKRKTTTPPPPLGKQEKQTSPGNKSQTTETPPPQTEQKRDTTSKPPTTQPRRPRQTDKSSRKKIIGLALAMILGVAALSGALYYFIENDGDNEVVEGVLIPKRYIEDSNSLSSAQDSNSLSSAQTSQEYYLAYENEGEIETMSVETEKSTPELNGIRAGTFYVDEETNQLKDWEDTESDQKSEGDISGMMDQNFENIEVEVNSVSATYDGYSFGVGLGEDSDHLWFAPDEEYATLFNDVRLEGVVVDEDFLKDMKEEFPDSVFLDMDLGHIDDFSDQLSFSYEGREDAFVFVEDIEYLNTVNTETDVLDAYQPEEALELTSGLDTSGSEWMGEIIGDINQGLLVSADRENTFTDSTYRFLLYDTGEYASFSGITDLEIAVSDFSTLKERVTFSGDVDFKFDTKIDIDASTGVVTDVTQDTSNEVTIPELYDLLDHEDELSMVEGVETTSFSLVIDAESVAKSLSDTLELDDIADKTIENIASFRNPAIAFMFEEDIVDTLQGIENTKDMKSLAEKGAIAIIPDYETDPDSALRYLDIEGVLYNTENFFEVTDPLLGPTPLIIADDYESHDDEIQTKSVEEVQKGDVETNEHGWAHVEFSNEELLTGGSFGISMKKIAEHIPKYGRLVRASPVDLGLYASYEIESSLDPVKNVPVIMLAPHKAPQGVEMPGLDAPTVEAFYIEDEKNLESILDSIENATEEGVLDLSDVRDALPIDYDIFEELDWSDRGVIVAMDIEGLTSK